MLLWRCSIARRYDVDETDLAIIRLLEIDGRRPFTEIADELKLAASTVQQRATRLIDNGLMKVRAIVEPAVIGLPVNATLAVKCDSAKMVQAAYEIARFDSVDYVVLCTGPYDILLEVACRDNDDLLHFISDSLAHVDGIRNIETFLYLRMVKNSYKWEMQEPGAT